MATKLWHVPVRLATGAIIVDQGLQKLGADEDTAKWLHGQAVHAFPQFADMDPKDFMQLLSASEITLGAALLGIGFVPSGLAGLGLSAFGGLPDPALPHRPGDPPRGHRRPQPAGRRPGQGLLDAGHRPGPGARLGARGRPPAPQEDSRSPARDLVCDSSGGMRVLAVVAALTLTLAVAAPVAGAPSLASSGCPLFPADNVWHADVSPPAGASPVGRVPGRHGHRRPASTPTSAPGPGRAARSGSRSRSSAAGQPRVPVRFGYADESDPGPYPIPPDAPVEGGPAADGDRHVLVVQDGSCRLYELFDAHREGRRLAGRVGGGLRPAGQRAAAGRLDLGRRRRAADPGRAGPLRRGGQGPGRPRHPGHRRRSQAAYLWPARHHAGARPARRCRRWGCGCG